MDNNLRWILRRPLSFFTAVLSILIILYEVFQISSGNLYQEQLNDIDGTTLIMLGILMLWGVFTLRDRTDLHAASFTLVNALSFIFIYEAIYKWSFYLAPFGKPMPPPELRAFAIQIGTALTVLTGFAVRDFTIKKWTIIWLGIFVILWVFWLLVGFPQITGESFFPQVILINFTPQMTYLLNRVTKLAMFLTYLTIYPRIPSPIGKGYGEGELPNAEAVG
jgi:hypothetical protein